MLNADSQRYLRLVALTSDATASPNDEDAVRELLRVAARRSDAAALATACATLTPSADHWAMICEALQRCSPRIDLSALHEPLLAWPARLREMPMDWIDDLLDGADRPWFALVGRVDLSWRFFESHVLARARHLRHVEELVLNECDLGPSLADGLRRAEQLGSLRRLDLSRNGIGNRGLQRLAVAPHLRNIVCLDLSANHCGEPGVRALVDSPLSASLRALFLRDNPIGDDGARLLARSGVLQRLDELDLHRCAIGDDGIEDLVRVMRAGGLRALDVGANVLGHAGEKAIDTLRSRGWMEIRG